MNPAPEDGRSRSAGRSLSVQHFLASAFIAQARGLEWAVVLKKWLEPQQAAYLVGSIDRNIIEDSRLSVQ